ncbi:hypothetical protein BGZ80_009758 [Entomortierella chlamydospora]|uniref:Uncharacterized protein n=1 Tax=Entomortierella chlamydospora TaxID=101097 RepID=A0A9P6MVR8_9FUNG|nr:hypothetical protein BGZ80_009758 [Entomortierella chlamydospora]
MSDLTSVLLQQIEQLEKERKILQTQYTRLPANNTENTPQSGGNDEKKDGKDEKKDGKDEKKDGKDEKKDGKDEKKDSTDERNSIQKFRDLLLEGDTARALKVQGLTETLVHLTLPPNREVRLAEVQRDEKIRLAEIAREEKVRLQELANEEKERQAKIAGDEKVRLAELGKEEKIRLAEEREKIRLRELSKELHEQEKNKIIRLEELKLDGIRFVEGARKDLDLRLAELEMPARRIYATKDAAMEEHESSEKKLAMILKHIETITGFTHCIKAKSSDNTHCIANATEATGTPPEYVFGDVERAVQLTERVAALFGPTDTAYDLESEHGAGDIPSEAVTAESSDDIQGAEASEAPAEQAPEAPAT